MKLAIIQVTVEQTVLTCSTVGVVVVGVLGVPHNLLVCNITLHCIIIIQNYQSTGCSGWLRSVKGNTPLCRTKPKIEQ